MVGHRYFGLVRILSFLSILLVLVAPGAMAGPEPTPVFRFATKQLAACAPLAWYAGTMLATGEAIDAEEATVASDDLQTWTAADYDRAIALYDTILAQLDRITPPPAAVAFHQTIRDGVVLYQDALRTMKTEGPFALLAYLNQFDQLTTQAGNLALPLEEQCHLALYDNDGDGEPEIGPGVATPVSDADSSSAEASPVAFASDGRPIVPVGSTVRISDAFSLTVVSVDQNAIDAVPTPPPAGFQFVNVELRLGHLRDQTDTFSLENLIALGPTNVAYSAVNNSCGFVNGPLSPGAYTGTMTMTGHVCFVIASSDIAGLRLADFEQPPDQRVYLSLDPAAG